MAERKPVVLVSGQLKELPAVDTLPPQAPASHSHATSDVTGLDDALSGKEPTISAGTTAQYWRGDKTWRDFFTDVRAATLTGLSTATNAVIDAADTVLAALGKLQAQITGHVGSAAGAHSASAISNTPSGDIAATNVQAAINELDSEKLPKTGGTVTGNLLVGSGVIGYGAGSGGTVVQATSKTTSVSLNKASGQITMHNDTLAAGAAVTFQINNILIANIDSLIATLRDDFSPANYSIRCSVGTGGGRISLTNISGGSLAEGVVINFMVIKGATS